MILIGCLTLRSSIQFGAIPQIPSRFANDSNDAGDRRIEGQIGLQRPLCTLFSSFLLDDRILTEEAGERYLTRLFLPIGKVGAVREASILYEFPQKVKKLWQRKAHLNALLPEHFAFPGWLRKEKNKDA